MSFARGVGVSATTSTLPEGIEVERCSHPRFRRMEREKRPTAGRDQEVKVNAIHKQSTTHSRNRSRSIVNIERGSFLE